MVNFLPNGINYQETNHAGYLSALYMYLFDFKRSYEQINNSEERILIDKS